MSEDQRRLESATRLEIVRSARRINYYNDGQLVKTYPVAVGKNSTPTPLGIYKVVNKVLNPGGVLGTRWMGLNIPGGNYGIHGTNNPSSIGKFISNGCIRLQNKDVEELFPKINIGVPVIISDTKDGYLQEPAPGRRRHTVRPGDTLWKISSTYGVPLNAIIQANNLTNPDLLHTGQVLIIP